MEKLTKAQEQTLRDLPTKVYSPGQRTIDKFGTLIRAGFVDVSDVGSDEMQETIYAFTITDLGRSRLSEQEKK